MIDFFSMQQRAYKPLAISTKKTKKTCRFVHQYVLKRVNSVVRIYCFNNRVASLLYFKDKEIFTDTTYYF